MGFDNEYEYYDDADEYYEDEESYIDYTEDEDDTDAGSSRSSSLRSSIRPYGSSSSGSGETPEERKERLRSRFRSGSSDSGSRFGGSSKLPGSTPYSRQRDDEESSGSSRFGGSSGSSRFGSSSTSSGSRFGGGGNLPGSTSYSRQREEREKASSKDADKKDEPKTNRRFGIKSPFGGGDKSDDKKDSKAAKSSGKKDDNKSGSRFGIKSPFGGGDKSDDKKDSKAAKSSGKKDDNKSGGGILGGLGGRFGRGKSADKKDDQAAPRKGDAQSSSRYGTRSSTSQSAQQESTSNRRFGIKSPFGGGDKSDDKPDSKAATPRGRTADDRSRTSPLGQRSRESDGKSSRSRSSSASEQSRGGVFSAVTGLFSRGEKQQARSGSTSRRTRTSKVPQANTEGGLTLDNWLDILGVGLVFGSLILFFSAISQEQAAIAAVHTFIGQIFGWGALAVPVAMFAVGMWLIVRHFGEEAPTVDPIRMAGVALGFVSLLVLFQFAHAFSYTEVLANATDQAILQQLLRARLNYAWEVELAGGGIVGAEIYYFLVTNVTEVGGFFLTIFALLISAMLITRLTAAEIVRSVAGMWLGMREGMKKRASKRRAERQLAAQRAAEAQAAAQAQAAAIQAAQASGSAPEAASDAEAPQESAPLGGREIRITSGGHTATVNPQPQANAQAAPPPPAHTPQTVPPSNGGQNNRRATGAAGLGLAAAVGSLLNRSGSNSSPAPPPRATIPDTPLPMDDGYSHFDQPAAPSSTPTQSPAATTFLEEPEQPAPASEDAEPTVRMLDLLKPQSQEDTPEAPASAQPAAESPAEDAPAASAEDTTAADDPVSERQRRLDALRRGEAGPLSQSNLAAARRQNVVANAGPSTQSPPQSIKVGPERVTMPQSFTPPSKLPSVQSQTEDKPRQQRLSAEPVSSDVKNQTRVRPNWRLPEYSTLLSSGGEQEFDREDLLRQAKIIEDTLQAFGAPGRVVEVNTGPVITQFGVEPDYITGRSGKKQRVKVSAIAALDKDLQLALGARSIRVEAPVPGKGYVGVEVPNKESTLVSLRDVMDSSSFQKIRSPLTIALGQSVSGAPISADLRAMPHLLIAGTTGSGKSVCVNSIIASILARNTPDKVKFIMVDPKRVELTGYNGVPHLVAPVVVELERIVGVLKWVTREMDKRYKQLSDRGARNIEDYNKHVDPNVEDWMPYIVVIIDELADLMMLAPEETERSITRIAALARAVGIHLVIATQRPSVDVVTGLIKANFPARVAFAVAGSVDSRVILDQPGAERLLGKGDMLYMSGNSPAPLRLQGVFVSDMEINNITRYWKMQALQQPTAETQSSLTATFSPQETPKEVMPRGERVRQQAFWDTPAQDAAVDDEESILDEPELTGDGGEGSEDELYEKAVELVRRLEKASISLLQRRLRIGYTRAARLIDMMEARGVVGPAREGSSKPREVLPQR